MKVLLFGSGGMLAHDLMAEAPADLVLATRTHREVDVTDEAAVTAAIIEAEPNVIINCAAYTNVDGAEADRERAFAVNGQAPGVIGRAASAPRAPHPTPHAPRAPLVVHFSTDYVFNGRSDRPYREDDPTEPLGVYGASKLAGERALAQSGARYVIIRTSWLFGFHGRSFPRAMWQRAIERQLTKVVSDQVGRPTYTVDLARAAWRLLRVRRAWCAGADGEERSVGDALAPSSAPTHRAPRTSGILHVTNAGTATWYDIARRIFEAATVPELLAPCPTAEYPTPARRPAYSVLDTSRYEALTGTCLPRWEDALTHFLAQLSHG